MICTVPVLALLASVATSGEVSGLIDRLGGPDYRERERATARLDTIGRPALRALRESAANADPETARRASDLVTRITARAESEDALTPTLVALSAEDRPLAEVLADLEKQSGYRLVLSAAEPSVRVTVRTAGKVPFWAAVGKLCEAANLEVAEVAGPGPVRSPTTPTGDIFLGRALGGPQMPVVPGGGLPNAAGDNRGGNAGLAQQAREMIAVRELEREEIEQRLKTSLGAGKKELEAQLAVQDQRIAQLRSVLNKLDPAGAHLPLSTAKGLVALRPSVSNRSSSIAGAVRVEPVPPPPSMPGLVPGDTIPVLVALTPEPRLHSLRVQSVSITKVLDPSGRPLETATETGSVNSADGDRIVLPDGRLALVGPNGQLRILGTAEKPSGYVPPKSQGYALLKRPADGLPAKLSVVEGVARCAVRLAEDLVAVKGLNQADKASATGVSDTAVTARLAPSADEKTADITVIVRHDPSRVALNRAAPDPVQVRRVGAAAGVAGRRVILNGSILSPTGDAESFAVTDAAGKPFTLTILMSEVSTEFQPGGAQQTAVWRVRLRATRTGDGHGLPERLAVCGIREKTIAVPFTLTDVPVTVGTGPVGK